MTETPRPTISVSPTTAPVALAGAADMILVNGKVITVDATDTIAQAVAIKDGLIHN